MAITSRDDFLLELGEALGGQMSVRPVEGMTAALEHTSGSRRPQVLAIDARGVAALRADVERAHAEAPAAPIIVFAPADAEKSVAGALKGTSVLAVLSLPIDQRRMNAVFENAAADATARHGAARSASAAAGASADSKSAPQLLARQPLVPEPAALAKLAQLGEQESRRGRPLLLWAGLALGVLALGGAGAYWFLQGNSARGGAHGEARGSAAAGTAASPVSTEARTADVPLVKGKVDELLEKARLAMRERRYTEPASDCALLYYRSALATDPANSEAHDGLVRLTALLSARFDDALAGNRYDEAAQSLAALKLAAPGDPSLASAELRLVQAEVSRAFADSNFERAAGLIRQAQQSGVIPAEQIAKWRAELGRRQDDAREQRLQELYAERMRDGHLIDPENDSARFYVARLKELAPTSPVAQRAARDLVAALLHKARDAAVGGHPADADRWLAEARSSGATPAELSAYQRDLASARQRAAAADAERLAGLVRERIQRGALTDPPDDSAVRYMTQLRDSYGSSALAGAVAHELAAKLLERANAEARAGQGSLLQSDLTLARQWGADPAQVQAIQQLGLTRAGGAGAQSAAGSGGGAVQLKRTHYVAPTYPDNALQSHISGAVTVEFTVDERGRPRDIRVTDSSPPRVFDKAAVYAVERWRFEPVTINGAAAPVSTRTVIRFQLPK